MENYEALSLAFKGMLTRTKTMKIRQEKLEKIIKNCTKKQFIENEQIWDIQLEYDGIRSGLEYLKPEIKRTIIMLKICLYRQKNGKNNCVNPVERGDCANKTSKFEQKLVTTNTTDEILSVDQNRLSLENSFQIPDIQRSHHFVEQIHLITSKSEPNIERQEVQTQNSGGMTSTTVSNKPTTNLTDQQTSVNFENVLTLKFTKFTDEKVIIRMGIG